MAEAKTNEPQATSGSGKGMKIVVGAMALALVASVGAIGYLMGHRGAPAATTAEAAHEETAVASKASEPIFLALDPPFVVNFQSESATRFLQVGVQLMSHDQKALDAAKASEPAVRNALVMLFSSQDARTLASRVGAELQKIVGERAKGAAIDAVYFTSFVMQ